MTRINIVRDVFPHDFFVRLQQIRLTQACFGGQLEGDVHKLAHARVEFSLARVMTERINELKTVPLRSCPGRWQVRRVDRDHGGIGGAQLVYLVERGGVDFFHKGKSFPSRLGQPNEFLQPGVPAVLMWMPGTCFCHGAPHDRIETELIASAMDAEFQIRGQAVTLDGISDNGKIVAKFLLELREVADIVNARFVESSGKLRRDGLNTNLLVGKRSQDNQQFRSVWGASVSSIETSAMIFSPPFFARM